MENNYFYFIYVAIGPPFVKTVIHNFSSIPKDTNVVVLTNTPKLLENLEVQFNLIVVDIESLRDEWSKENELIAYGEDDDDYIKEFKKLHDNNVRYPMQIMRFGIKWAYLNNITKFLVMESGMTIGFDTDPTEALNNFKKWGENKNLLFANTYYYPGLDKAIIYLKTPEYREIVEKYGADVDNYPDTFDTEYDPNFNGSIEFEGGMFGMWFHDVSLVEMCFNLYSDMVKVSYNSPHIASINGWSENFEWISAILIFVFAKFYNTMIVGYNRIVVHFPHPEEFYFMPQVVQSAKKEWVTTSTRESFIEKNRGELITLFNGVERAKKLCYDFK